jgi:cell division cycle 20-like protein 1, cofactor of APC complex
MEQSGEAVTAAAATSAAATLQPSKRPVEGANNGSSSATPARLSTPPPPADRGRLQARLNVDNANTQSARRASRTRDVSRSGGAGIDAERLSRALSHELSADRRASTPSASPSRKRQRINGDRYVTRTGFSCQVQNPADFCKDSFHLGPGRTCRRALACYMMKALQQLPRAKRNAHLMESFISKEVSHARKMGHLGAFTNPLTLAEEANRTFSTLLRSELFENTIPQATPPSLSPDANLPGSNHSTRVHDPTRSHTPPNNPPPSLPSTFTPSTPHKNLFSYMSPRHHTSAAGHPTPTRTPQSRHGPNLDTRSEIYSLSPVRFGSQQMLLSPRRQPRAVSKVPYKVLDAPELADDFYLNLVDWGSANVLGVGLGSSVYMWNAQTSRVNKLCTLEDDTVTSVSWIQKGTHIAIGTGKGLVQIWDAEKTRRLRTMTGHTARVGSLAWNTHILTSGSRDRLIYHRDVRAPDQWMRKLMGHKQEVCGLKWNCEDGQLASGGNDNKLMVWDKLSETPLWKFSDHTAAVKAISWSPHQRGLLASGGGTADRRIIFHDTVRGTVINEVDTGSQVCNIAWSKNSNEIVSTHGYSQNQIVVWKYPSMTQVVSLTGHTYRVLYLAMSPDGRTVVTGAGDETLRFWTVFGRRPGAKEDGESSSGRLADWGVIR